MLVEQGRQGGLEVGGWGGQVELRAAEHHQGVVWQLCGGQALHGPGHLALAAQQQQGRVAGHGRTPRGPASLSNPSR